MKRKKIMTPNKSHQSDKPSSGGAHPPRIPNAETRAAMDELRDGKGVKFKDVSELFKSI